MDGAFASSLRSRKSHRIRREGELAQLDAEPFELEGAIDSKMPPHQPREAQAEVGSQDELLCILRGDRVTQIGGERVESPYQDGRERLGRFPIAKLCPRARARSQRLLRIVESPTVGGPREIDEGSVEEIELGGNVQNELDRRSGGPRHDRSRKEGAE